MLTPEWTKSSFSFSNGNCIEAAWWPAHRGTRATVGGYRKSSASYGTGNCTEVGGYRTSSASYGGGQCAEVASGARVVAVRDTKEAHLGEVRTVLEFTPVQWRGLLAGIKTGRMVRP